jgi:hypothetical protein
MVNVMEISQLEFALILYHLSRPSAALREKITFTPASTCRAVKINWNAALHQCVGAAARRAPLRLTAMMGRNLCAP